MVDLPAIAFVGLGIMGRPMAGHLLHAGYPLHVFSRTRSKAETLLAAGATWFDSPAACAAGADVLITCVTDTPDVLDVLFGVNGAAGSLSRGSCVVDTSTIAPSGARQCTERLSAAGVDFLDAPVTGGEIGAQNATLTIMVGGPGAAFERVRPILATLGKTVVHVGPSGAGQALKACNQILCALNMIGVCEALMLAREAGLDARQAIETLAGGAGGSWAWTNLAARLAGGDLNPAFMIRLMQKDLRIVQELAQQEGIPLPGTALAQQLFRAVEAVAGGGALGTQAMILAYERMRGLSLAGH
ncbi:MAG: 2-hydroxy-3-oxopropionate reductase [Phycisphaerae bacterium]|nr:2-hydroxy-3-oxopropionate reductase [Phycisphaerae bacterium]